MSSNKQVAKFRIRCFRENDRKRHCLLNEKTVFGSFSLHIVCESNQSCLLVRLSFYSMKEVDGNYYLTVNKEGVTLKIL
jgi:hypothetical protein